MQSNSGKHTSLREFPQFLDTKGFFYRSAKRAWVILGRKTKKLQEVLRQSIPEGLISKYLMKKVVNAIEEGGVLPDKIKAADPGLQTSGTKRWDPPAYSRPEQSGIIV